LICFEEVVPSDEDSGLAQRALLLLLLLPTHNKLCRADYKVKQTKGCSGDSAARHLHSTGSTSGGDQPALAASAAPGPAGFFVAAAPAAADRTIQDHLDSGRALTSFLLLLRWRSGRRSGLMTAQRRAQCGALARGRVF
jgi:hypothetical protein